MNLRNSDTWCIPLIFITLAVLFVGLLIGAVRATTPITQTQPSLYAILNE